MTAMDAAALLLGYLLGSIPFGLVLTRAAGYGDIRQIGSGNIGATNVLRTGNKPLALAVLVLDAGKGALAYGAALLAAPATAAFAGAAAVAGHLFPLFLGFRGGKGVAPFLGFLIALDWRMGGLACASWLVTALLLRYSSLSALVAIVCTPFFAFWLADMTAVGLLIALGAVIAWRHSGNIRRLWLGTEPKLGTGPR